MDVVPLAADAVDQYARLYVNRRISLLRECASCEVIGDPELIRLAVSQLLDNACKYSDDGAAVTLRLSGLRRDLAIHVLSKGVPILPAETERIFDRFYRGTEDHRAAAGSGLGLYVARKIALAHGGSLNLDRDYPYPAVAFCLTLPVPER